jgi:hypothetical protein
MAEVVRKAGNQLKRHNEIHQHRSQDLVWPHFAPPQAPRVKSTSEQTFLLPILGQERLAHMHSRLRAVASIDDRGTFGRQQRLGLLDKLEATMNKMSQLLVSALVTGR